MGSEGKNGDRDDAPAVSPPARTEIKQDGRGHGFRARYRLAIFVTVAFMLLLANFASPLSVGNWLVYAGLMGAIAMFHQQMLMSRWEDGPDITSAVRSYKTNVVYTLGVVMLLELVAALLCMIGIFVSPNELGVLPNGYLPLLETKGRGPLLLLVLGVYVSALRLFFERTVDEAGSRSEFFKDLRKTFSFRASINPKDGVPFNPRHSRNEDMWLYFFATTILAEVVIEAGIRHIAWFKTEPPGKAVFVTMTNLMVGVTYFAWVYMGAFRNLTSKHKFSGVAAREYLGALQDTSVPRQAVIMGPKESGKSACVEGTNIGQDARWLENTATIRSTRFTTNANGPVVRYVSVLDTPGENIGDQLVTFINYRADPLVLMLRDLELNMADLKSPGPPPELCTFAETFCLAQIPASPKLKKTEAEWTAQRYMQALQLATRRSDRVPSPFSACSFVLYINVEDEWAKEDRESLEKKLKGLSVELGKRFGVANDRCTAFVGRAVNRAEGRDRLVQLFSADTRGAAPPVRTQDGVAPNLGESTRDPRPGAASASEGYSTPASEG